MKTKFHNAFYTKALIVAISFMSFFILVANLNSQTIHAQSQNTNTSNIRKATEDEINAIATALEDENNSCPEPIKQRYLDIINSGGELYADGTTIVAFQGDQAVVMNCANASALNKIVIRGIMVLFSLLGLALAFAVGRSAIMMVSSFGNSELFETGVKGLVTAIMYTVGVIFFYTIFIFVAVDVMGIGQTTGKRKEFNLFCSNQIIVNITFDQQGNCG